MKGKDVCYVKNFEERSPKRYAGIYPDLKFYLTNYIEIYFISN